MSHQMGTPGLPESSSSALKEEPASPRRDLVLLKEMLLALGEGYGRDGGFALGQTTWPGAD